MRKIGQGVCIGLLLFGLVFAGNSQSVSADNGVATGDWSSGSAVVIDLEQNPSPDAGLQLFSNGVKVDAPTEICHPFRGAQFHWVPEIRRLVNGKWVKLITVTRRLTTEEGTFVACASAPAAGTYALFAYYDGPAEMNVEPTATCSLNTDSWRANKNATYLIFYADNLEGISTVHFKVTSYTSGVVTVNTMEGDAAVAKDGYYNALLTTYSRVEDNWVVKLDVTVQGCTKSLTINGNAE